MNASYLRMTGPQIAGLGSPILLLPLGSVEQHGGHLPVDTDSVIANFICNEVATRLSALVAPGFPYGCRSQPVSGGGELFPGTVGIHGTIYSKFLADILVSYARHGLNRIVLVVGHFENAQFAIEGATIAQECSSDLRVIVLNWWDVPTPAQLDSVFAGSFPGWEAEHAGIVETSLMLHLDPDAVRTHLIEDRISEISPPPYTVVPERHGLVDPSGVLRTATGSSSEIGRKLFDQLVADMVDLLANEEYLQPRVEAP